MKEYSPQELAVKRRKLALEYKEKLMELAEIRKKKAITIIELMAVHKTKSKAEVYFEATEEGQKEIELEMYTRGLLELMRSVKSEIDIKQGEAYSQY